MISLVFSDAVFVLFTSGLFLLESHSTTVHLANLGGVVKLGAFLFPFATFLQEHSGFTKGAFSVPNGNVSN